MFFSNILEKISPDCWHEQKTLNGKYKLEKTTYAHIYLKPPSLSHIPGFIYNFDQFTTHFKVFLLNALPPHLVDNPHGISWLATPTAHRRLSEIKQLSICIGKHLQSSSCCCTTRRKEKKHKKKNQQKTNPKPLDLCLPSLPCKSVIDKRRN